MMGGGGAVLKQKGNEDAVIYKILNDFVSNNVMELNIVS